jgi:hypothetical protein
VALQVFLLDLAVRAGQESIQLQQGDMNPGEEAMRRFTLPGDDRCGVIEAILFQPLIAFPPVAEDAAAGLYPDLEKPLRRGRRRTWVTPALIFAVFG